MATMNISLPDPMRDYVEDQVGMGLYANISDYVGDLIRRDQAGVGDQKSWLRALDASIAESLAEMEAGGGIDVDTAAADALSPIVKGRPVPGR